MNVSKQLISALILFSVVMFLGGPLWAQEPFTAEGIPPESDFVYGKHYEQVQEIISGPLAEREKKLETFFGKCDPKAKILQHKEAYFNQLLQEYKKAGMTAQADALSQKMLKMFPKRPLVKK